MQPPPVPARGQRSTKHNHEVCTSRALVFSRKTQHAGTGSTIGAAHGSENKGEFEMSGSNNRSH